MPMIRCQKLTKACLEKFRQELAQMVQNYYPSGDPVHRFASSHISSASEDYILLQAIEVARKSLREKAKPPEAK